MPDDYVKPRLARARASLPEGYVYEPPKAKPELTSDEVWARYCVPAIAYLRRDFHQPWFVPDDTQARIAEYEARYIRLHEHGDKLGQ